MIAHTHRREIWASIDVFELESYMTPSPPPLPGLSARQCATFVALKAALTRKYLLWSPQKLFWLGGFWWWGVRSVLAMSNGGVSAACTAHAPSGRVRKSEKRQSVFARGAGLKDTHACGILVRLASESTDSVSHTAFGDPRSSCWKQARTHARTHADAPLTGLSRRGRCCGIGGSRRTKAAVSGTSRTRTVHSTVLVSYHS